MSEIYDIPVKRIDGSDATLAPYRGKVLLIVNVASECGLTPQYEELEKLYQQKRARGFEVLEARAVSRRTNVAHLVR